MKPLDRPARNSLLMSSAPTRIVLALALIGLLWLAVGWAFSGTGG